ncbi:MAG: hypothetical protein JW713_08030, partial [Pontiellaceae bacterium]|nr:hypothetical protein [Pontiellaceae bacterium]
MKSYIGIIIAVSLSLSALAEVRTWSLSSGETIEAEYLRNSFDSVVLKTADGKEHKIQVSDLVEADQKEITLLNPPELSLDLLRSAEQVKVPESPYHDQPGPMLLLYTFGARIKQLGTKNYPYPLTVEVYALSKQCYDPDKYHLIQVCRSKPFVLSKENNRRFEFESKNPVRLIRYQIDVNFLNWIQPGGEEYGESLILVKDERGEIIAYDTTASWLYENYDKLRKLPVGAWMNNACKRVHPTPLKDVRVGEAPQF